MDQPKKSNRGCWIAAGITALLMVAIFGTIGMVLYRSYKTFAPTTDKFLTAIDNADYNTAYSMAGSQWKAVSTLEQFTEFESRIRSILGTHKSTSMSNMNYQSINGRTTASVVYSAQFEKGQATLSFNLTEENGTWFVQGVHYNSDLIQQAMFCPACKTQNSGFGKFCTNCGKPLPGTTPSPAEVPDPPQK